MVAEVKTSREDYPTLAMYTDEEKGPSAEAERALAEIDELRALKAALDSIYVDPMDYRVVVAPEGNLYTPGDLMAYLVFGAIP